MPYVVYSGGEYYFHYALRSIFGGCILNDSCTTLYFRGANTMYTIHYVVYSGDEYYLYYALRSIFGAKYYLSFILRSMYFGGWILLLFALRRILGRRLLFILCTTQYFRAANTMYTMHYAVFSGGEYYVYYALRNIFEGRILFITYW